MLYVTYLAADTTNGLYKIDPIDYPDMELTPPNLFISSLDDLDDDELIFTVFGPESEDLYNSLMNEYGISE